MQTSKSAENKTSQLSSESVITRLPCYIVDYNTHVAYIMLSHSFTDPHMAHVIGNLYICDVSAVATALNSLNTAAQHSC